MGRAARDLLKRKAAQAHKGLNDATFRIAELHVLFDDHHKELAKALVASAQLAQEADRILLQFCEVAWAMEESSLESYRA